MKLLIILLTCLILPINLYGQDSRGLSLSVSLGFGSENEKIAPIDTSITVNISREIEYVRALSIGIGKYLNKRIIVGGEIIYYWAVLDFAPDFSGPGGGLVQSINNVSWLSLGAWGKYIFFPESRFHLGIMGSAGAHIGYPEKMGYSTIERQVSAYLGIHGGVEYNIFEKVKISYYFGRGKYNNIITIDYNF